MKVLLLKGGPDAEREVSLRSGTEVAAALRQGGFAVEEVTVDRPGLAELRAMRGDVVFLPMARYRRLSPILFVTLQHRLRSTVSCANPQLHMTMSLPCSMKVGMAYVTS